MEASFLEVVSVVKQVVTIAAALRDLKIRARYLLELEVVAVNKLDLALEVGDEVDILGSKDLTILDQA